MAKNALKLGVIGGALDSAVGRCHHIALQMDGRFRIVAGCFSAVEKSNKDTAAMLGVASSRLYGDWHSLMESERGRVDAVLLLTPTPLHAEMAVAALKSGFPVISEKAIAVSSTEAAIIRAHRDSSRGVVVVTYNYTGYPMVRELRAMIERGFLGDIVHIEAEMPQEGFLRLVGIDNSEPRPQPWRLKDNFIPTVSLDLGVHLHQIIKFIAQSSPVEVCALEQNRGHFKGIVDNVHCLATYDREFSVHFWYGKISLGNANGLRIRIFGTKGSAEWFQMNPELLTVHDNLGHSQVLSRASNSMEICTLDRYNRFKPGHPAGFIEAFANYYFDIADYLISHLRGDDKTHPMVSGVEVAEEGLRMMEAISRSARNHSWERV